MLPDIIAENIKTTCFFLWLLTCVVIATAQQTVPKNLFAAFKAGLAVTHYKEGGWSGNATLDGGAFQMQLSNQAATQATYFGSIGPGHGPERIKAELPPVSLTGLNPEAALPGL